MRVLYMFLLSLALMFSGWMSVANAIDSFVIQDIRVQGLEKIESGTVFNYLPLKVGDTIDQEEARESIRALFKTGFFDDVTLEQDGSTLVVIVTERSSIAEITLDGNKEFKDEVLIEALKSADIAEGRIYNKSAMDKAIAEIKNQYLNRGKYAADVDVSIEELDRNRVSLALEFFEGDTAKIKEINIVGNKAFDDKKLLKQFNLSSRNLFGFFSKKDQYSKQKLSADLESLRNYYQDRGFLEFEINSTNVSISPNKQDIFINLSVTEGAQFMIDEINIQTSIIASQEELLPLITLKIGDAYSRQELTKSRTALTDNFADKGYAFANVNAVPKIDRNSGSVSFDFVVDPGRRVYVRRIEIEGNTNTRDEVIRRELRQLESSWYSSAQIRRSRERLRKLGYFDDVTIETPQVPGSADQVDLIVTVKERSTGSFLFGVGYSDADGVLIQANASQRSLFGSGKELTVSLDNSDTTETIELRFRNPYHTIDGVSRGFFLNKRDVDSTDANTAEYLVESVVAGVSYQIPLSEFDSLNLSFAAERIDLTETDGTPEDFKGFIGSNPSSDNLRTTIAVSRDTRDAFFFPDTGSIRRASLETTVPGSDLEYYRLTLGATLFKPVSDRFTLKFSGEIGYGDGYGDTGELPFYKNFFVGGPSSLRGFDSRSLGPSETDDGTDGTSKAVGGNQRIILSSELLFKLPGLEKNNDRIRMSLFVDGGMVYGNEENFDLSEVRYSAGTALSWFTPVGPLGISYAVPLNDKDGDEVENFQLTLGSLSR